MTGGAAGLPGVRRSVLLVVNWRLDGHEFPALRRRFPDAELWGFRTPWNPRGLADRVLRHWPALLRLSLAAWRRAPRYQVLVAASATSGLLLGMLYRLAGVRHWPVRFQRASVVVLTLIDVPRRGLGGLLRRAFVGFCLGGVDRVTTASQSEARRLVAAYGLPARKCVCLPQSVSERLLPAAPVSLDGTDPYIFAAGRSLRDYGTLFAAVTGSSYTVRVVCQPQNVAGLTVPPNVEVRFDVYGEAFVELRRRARLVVIPLGRDDASAGLLELLFSMGEGKAVVATRTAAIAEHVTDGRDGLLVPGGEPRALREAIDRLWADTARLEALGTRAFQTVRERFSSGSREARLIALVEDVMAERGPTR